MNNKDCLLKIASDLDFYDIYNLSLVCKKFKRDIYDNPIFWKSKLNWKSDSPKLYFYISNFKNAPEKGFQRAIQMGDLKIVKYFCITYSFPNIIYYNMAQEASSYGHLDIIIYLEDFIKELPHVFISCINAAIKTNQLDIIKYLMNKTKIEQNMIESAAITATADTMDVILRKYEEDLGGIDIFTRNEAMRVAKYFRNEDIVWYLRKRNLILDLLTIFIFLFYYFHMLK